MNESIKYSVRHALTEVGANSHSIHTVKSILVDLRDYSPNGSIIRELGDFLAHPEEKDRGIAHSNITEAFDGLIRFFRAARGLPVKGGSRFCVRPPFTDIEIMKDLFSLIAELGIASSSSTLMHKVREQQESVSACILCLLQGARFKIRSHKIPASICFISSHVHPLSKEYAPMNNNLGLYAYIPTKLVTGDDKFIYFVMTVVSTQLKPEEWIDFTKPISTNDRNEILYKIERDQRGLLKMWPIPLAEESNRGED